jgi:hypothetical protein
LRDERENAADKIKQKDIESSLRIEKAKLEEKLESATAQELDLTKLLENSKNELSLFRIKRENQIAIFENKLDRKQQSLEKSRQELENLRTESESLNFKEENLKAFVTPLGTNLQLINNFCYYYENYPT